MYRFVDRSRAPSLLDAQRWREIERAEGCGVYLPGPCAVSDQPSWTSGVVQWLLEAGFGLVFIFPGPQHRCHSDKLSFEYADIFGEEIEVAVRDLLGSLEVTTIPVAIDVEAPTSSYYPYEAARFAVRLARNLHDRGFYPGIYGVPSFLRSLEPESPTWVWVASWIREDWDDGLDLAHIPGFPDELWSLPNQRMWQFASTNRWLDLNYGNIELCRLVSQESSSQLLDKLQQIRDLAEDVRNELIQRGYS